MSNLATVLVLIAILAGLWTLGWVFHRFVAPRFQQRVRANPEAHRGVGKQWTLLELEPLSGDPPQLSLSDLQGHVTLLNFWGPWCSPCRDELPHLVELQRRFKGQKAFQLVLISYPLYGQTDELESLQEETDVVLDRLDLDLSIYCDPDDKTRDAVDQMIGFDGFPTTLLVDRQGVIRAVWVGYQPGVETEMETYVGKVLAESEKKGSVRKFRNPKIKVPSSSKSS
jgi:thiol-disulfide isomerase/thioredoxin